jgi:hypothetical protein
MTYWFMFEGGVMRRVVAVCVAASALAWSAEAAAAEPPAGSADTCTRGYEALTLPQVLALAERNGVPEERARNMFERVNKNEDDWICAKDQPSPQENHYNFKDNQAVGQDEP